MKLVRLAGFNSDLRVSIHGPPTFWIYLGHCLSPSAQLQALHCLDSKESSRFGGSQGGGVYGREGNLRHGWF